MRLVIGLDYQKVLFGKNAPIAELIAALDGAKLVDEEGGYSSPRRYIVKRDCQISVELINDDSVKLPENQNDRTFEQFHRLAKERDELTKERDELKKQLAEITATINKIRR